MYRVRFRDPAGSIRNGEWKDGAIEFADTTYNAESHDIDILPPTDPSKMICIGRNYAAHAAESGSDIPDRPLLFMKGPNALASHGDTITLPGGKERLDHEAEFAVVIGEQARNVSAANADDVIAGYSCANDLSNRDDQRQEQNWIRGKAFDNASPIGPVLATPDEVPDDAAVKLWLNGEKQQEGSIDDLIFAVPELIEEITTYITLEPGDVILTGTPSGVSPLSDGDHIKISVDGIPPLEHDVRIPN